MYQISFYVPESHLESVKKALFDCGAGQAGNYDQCAWQTLGQGQFRPRPGSQPFIGEQNTLTEVSEYKVELVCEDQYIEAAVAALKKAHPYEEPGYIVISLVNL